MEIQSRRRGRNTYLYLVQSYREAGKVRKVERYMGRKLPPSLAPLKEQLGQEIVARRWGPDLERIREGHSSNLERLPPNIRTKELDTFAIQFTYDSNRIEGSSLTLRETGLLLHDGITPSNRPLADVQEAIAHRAVFMAALTDRGPLDLPTVLAWHRNLFKETKPELAGVVRRGQVMISGSAFTPPGPFELDLLLTEFFNWLKVAWKTVHPVVLAALVHLRLVTIHPFGDGNGRVTRIAMNFVLHKKGFPMMDIPYRRRAGYYRALEKSQTSKDEYVFVGWFLRRYLDQNTRLIEISKKLAKGKMPQSGSKA